MKLTPKKVSARMGMDLTNEFNEFVKKHGVYVLLIRPLTNMLCRCYNPSTNEGDPECQECFGIGNKVRIERHKVRIASPASNAALADIAKTLAAGSLSFEPYKVYFKKTANVREGMFVVYTQWDNLKPIKSSDMRVIKISNLYNPIGEFGEVIYSMASGERHSQFEHILMNATIKDIVVIDK